MKRIGLLFGIDTNFPLDVISYVNSKKLKDISCEEIKIGITNLSSELKYDVIFDRISEYVDFYKSYLKTSKLNGSIVVGNCLSACYDDEYYQLSIAQKNGILTPRTALLPTKWLPPNTTPESMRNLIYPLNWDEMFEYVGFPAYLKPNSSNETLFDYKVYSKFEFYSAYELTGSNQMILQELVEYDEYIRCFVVGKKYIKIARYNPSNPLHLRYSDEEVNLDKSLENQIIELCKKLSYHYDNNFNAFEFAIKNDKVYGMVFNRAIRKIERHIIYDKNYDWLIETLGNYLIEVAEG